MKPISEETMRIGQAIVAKRQSLGMSQADLANAVHLSQGAVSRIEAGNRMISTRRLTDFAAVLQCKPAELIPDGSEKMRLLGPKPLVLPGCEVPIKIWAIVLRMSGGKNPNHPVHALLRETSGMNVRQLAHLLEFAKVIDAMPG